MRDHFDDEEESPISLADVMLKVLLMVFLTMIVLSVVAKKKAEEGNIKRKAEYVLVADWNKTQDPNLDCDVDLWVRNPEGQIVYWRSKENAMMNIERDDIGQRNDYFTDPNGKRIENKEDAEYWYLRAVIPGEYTANLHLYACKGMSGYDSHAGLRVTPFPVELKLTKLNPRSKLVATEVVTLDTVWQEKTAFNFTIGPSGDVTQITHIPTSMQSQTSDRAMDERE